MIRGKLLFGIGAVVTAGVIGATPLIGHAAGAEVVVAQGHTDVLTPVQWQGGGGSFHFTTNAPICVEAGTFGSGLCGIASGGSYTNIVCGTGNVLPGATANVTNVPTITYAITFAAGVGVITGSDAAGDTVAGVVLITPNTDNHAVPPPPTSNACVTDFLATLATVGA